MRSGADERHVRPFAAVPASAAGARAFVTSALSADGAPASTVDVAALVISELVSNMIEHGNGGNFDVVVDLREHLRWCVGVECALGAAGVQLPDPHVWSVAHSDLPSGRGLGIVRELSDKVLVATVDGRLAIECWLARPEP